ncbi:YidH family protein [Nocardia sp. NPDC060220]|uniref:YidH family protein n=1 Tax=Nocardia sp. NPDC060220 TaxID=3347076 RepID=UPI00365329EC
MASENADRDESPKGSAIEPLDYRFSLANERTFLAWIRTALGLLAGGVAVQTLAEQFSTSGFRRAIAVSCAGLAVVIAAVALRQWRRVETAMQRGDHLPGSALVPVLAVGVTGVALAAGTAVLVS